MINKLFYNYKSILFLSITLYISLIIGFFYGEDLNFGATMDWHGTNYPVIRDSAVDLKNTLLNYKSYGHRHSPLYPIFLGQFLKFGLSYELIRFIHLNTSILLIYIFYKCLILKFSEIDKKILLTLSLVIFLSPTFRSLSIWPDSRIIGVIFFTLSIYEYLKFKKKKLGINIWKNIIYLIISSYISPNFSVFIIYFFYNYLKILNLRTIIYISLFSLIMSLPAFYFLFVLDINFLLASTPGTSGNELIGLSFNFSNKILIISSIFMFHISPFLINKEFIKNFFLNFKKIILIPTIIFIICLPFFNYSTNFTGGGIFFQISNFFLDNNIIFYLLSFLSLLLVGYFSYKNLNNFLIFFLLILSNVQNTIYHKYYDPLILILFFTIFTSSLNKNFFKKKINLFYLYGFYFVFILLRILKNSVL